jgi:hypothetical protein
MTFKQTEVTEILKKLNDYANKYKFLNRLVKEAYNLYKKVPLYPGIVGMCVDNVIKEVNNLDEINPGDIIMIENNNIFYEGEVVDINNKIVKLRQVKILQEKESVEIEVSKNKVYKYNFSTLKQLWPSLDFEKK